MTRGRFITLEGGEGAGKSTQIRRLAETLRETTGLMVRETREPGGAPGAEAIRKLLVEGEPGRWDARTEALLHMAARREHLRSTVWPALERGEWVISDRYADSTTAYQGFGHGLGRELIDKIYQWAIGDFFPDLTLILDLPVEVGLARAGARAGTETRYERMDIDFHRRLREGFLAIAKAEPGRCAVINADRPVEAIAADIWAAVKTRLL